MVIEPVELVILAATAATDKGQAGVRVRVCVNVRVGMCAAATVATAPPQGRAALLRTRPLPTPHAAPPRCHCRAAPR